MSKDELKITTDGVTSLYELLDEMEVLSYETPKGFRTTLQASFHQKVGESCKGVKNE